jgi:hypothetical protein
MRRQTRQLPVADPLGYLTDATFAARVAKAVAGRVRSAPQPLLDFNPLRTGPCGCCAWWTASAGCTTPRAPPWG